jgi:acetamidase/formamidase/AraC-like DNA-binding protein
MIVRPYSSESYAEGDRPAAWQDVLGTVGLRSASPSALQGGHATAVFHAAEGVTIARFAAAPQVLSGLKSGIELPLILLPDGDGLVLKADGASYIVPCGHFVVLPRQGDWQVVFQRDMRAIGLSVTADAFHGRKVGAIDAGNMRVVKRAGLTDILCRTMEGVAAALESLSADDWTAVSQSLAEMLLSLLHQPSANLSAHTRTSTQAALLRRICQTIERTLDDPDLTPARVAQAEGISERYLQKLFESTGDNFTHYLRERRLQRAYADLSSPAEAHHSVSEIAFRYGFNDAAHFSRAFRERFGMPPSIFRQQEAERLAANAMHDATHGQRGWPQDALALLRNQPAAAKSLRIGTSALNAAPKAIGDGAKQNHHQLSINEKRVHWGYFSRSLAPLIEVQSGDTVTVETLTQHASDDPERMIAGDAGAESVFHWTRDLKTVDRRGAGPMDASIYGRGAGEGFGVHICTGPIGIRNAQPGDVLEVRILDIVPRRSRSLEYDGRVFGSSVAAWWGYHYAELLGEPKPREAVTIYEIFADDDEPYAKAVYSYRWEPQTDPFGVVHKTYDYPGIPVLPGTMKRRHAVLDGIRIPLRPHFGVIAVAPSEADLVDSVPPAYFGGNLDNWRLGKGAAVYLPVSVPGALLSIGDPHAVQGDGELSGTAIECSMTGTFEVILHKKADFAGQPFADLTYPLIETPTDWVLTGFSHPNYLVEFGAQSQSEVYAKSSLDLAMKDAFRKVRRFLMSTLDLSEDEAIALMSAAVDFGVTQVVDGNWGVHAILSKRLFDTHNPE